MTTEKRYIGRRKRKRKQRRQKIRGIFIEKKMRAITDQHVQFDGNGRVNKEKLTYATMW